MLEFDERNPFVLSEYWWSFCRATVVSLLNWISLKCQEGETVREVKWQSIRHQLWWWGGGGKRRAFCVSCPQTHTHTHIHVHAHTLLTHSFVLPSKKICQETQLLYSQPAIYLGPDIKRSSQQAVTLNWQRLQSGHLTTSKYKVWKPRFGLSVPGSNSTQT